MSTTSVETKRIPVLLYHRIDVESNAQDRPFCVHPAMFAKQMAWLADAGYATIDLHDLQRYYQNGQPLPIPVQSGQKRAIVITFDDGYYCNYSRAFPIMRAYGFTGTIFLATDLMRQPVPAIEAKSSFLSWEEIREMQDAGFSFQAHGCSHRPLDTLTLDEVAREARDSKQCIEQELPDNVAYFCYPFSRYNEAIKQIVGKAGYSGACGGPPFYADGPHDWYEIGRTEILWHDSFSQFRFKVRMGLGYTYFIRRQLGKVKRLFWHTSRG